MQRKTSYMLLLIYVNCFVELAVNIGSFLLAIIYLLFGLTLLSLLLVLSIVVDFDILLCILTISVLFTLDGITIYTKSHASHIRYSNPVSTLFFSLEI